MIRKVGDRGFGVHAERGGDEFRVHRVDEVRQPCDAQRADACVPPAIEEGWPLKKAVQSRQHVRPLIIGDLGCYEIY